MKAEAVICGELDAAPEKALPCSDAAPTSEDAEFETWASVGAPYREGYEVSSLGRVRDGGKEGRMISQSRGTLGPKRIPGYLGVSLMKTGLGAGREVVKVHRLVAIAFVAGRTEERREVNHKDMDKLNNRHANLEWMTHSENIRHGMERHPTWSARLRENAGAARRAVESEELVEGVRIRTGYDSMALAGEAMGSRKKSANIHHAINRGMTAYGKIWRYCDRERPIA